MLVLVRGRGDGEKGKGEEGRRERGGEWRGGEGWKGWEGRTLHEVQLAVQ